ncbi:unnamed protein product, partial [Closterium sp. NIES-54]
EDATLLRHALRYGTRQWGALEKSSLLPRRDNKSCCNRFLFLKKKFTESHRRWQEGREKRCSGERRGSPKQDKEGSSPSGRAADSVSTQSDHENPGTSAGAGASAEALEATPDTPPPQAPAESMTYGHLSLAACEWLFLGLGEPRDWPELHDAGAGSLGVPFTGTLNAGASSLGSAALEGAFGAGGSSIGAVSHALAGPGSGRFEGGGDRFPHPDGFPSLVSGDAAAPASAAAPARTLTFSSARHAPLSAALPGSFSAAHGTLYSPPSHQPSARQSPFPGQPAFARHPPFSGQSTSPTPAPGFPSVRGSFPPLATILARHASRLRADTTEAAPDTTSAAAAAAADFAVDGNACDSMAFGSLQAGTTDPSGAFLP